jgi:hypothetical protein
MRIKSMAKALVPDGGMHCTKWIHKNDFKKFQKCIPQRPS